MSDSKVSAAQARATAKWEKNNYDRSLIRFPKGTQERIKATGETINGFVNRLVKAELDGAQPVQAAQPQPQPTTTTPAATVPDQYGMELLRIPLPTSMHYNERISEAVYNGAAKSEKIFVMQALDRRLHEADMMMK